jgi:hypothetical protein
VSRILLVGEGPPPGPDATDTRFAQLRLHQLRTALAQEHEVHVVDCRDVPAPVPAADLIVTAGTFGPTRAGVAIAGERPLCVDLPGDPFADAQQVAAAGGGEDVAAEARAVFLPALARADAFLSVSAPSRYTVIGQLGALGRLVGTVPTYEWVHITPVAWEFPHFAEAEPRSCPTRVALFGSFNTWLDEQVLLDGLLLAMDRSGVEVDCVGGGDGVNEAGRARFAAAAAQSRHRGRFRFLPALRPHALAEVLSRCTHTVSVDRPGYEPELGSRTRLLFALHQGLRPIGSARCELARTLVAGGWMSEADGPEAIRDALSASPPLPDREPLRTRYSVAATTEGLRAWATRAGRTSPHPEYETLAALTRERDDLRQTLQMTWASPTWRALDRARRFLRR